MATSTTTKVLAGVGIGCAAIVVLCIVGVLAAGYWVKGKVDGLVAQGEVMKQQEERAKKLDAQFAFEAPATMEPVALTKERLDVYLGIRTKLDAVSAKYDTQLKKVTEADPEKKKELGLGDLAAAGGAMMDLMKEQRTAFLDELEAKQMSPKEFFAISNTIQAAKLGLEALDVDRGRRDMLTDMKLTAEENAKDPTLTKAMRDHWAKSAKRYDAELAKLPPPPQPSEDAVKLNAANQQLLAEYGEKIPAAGFDPYLLLPGQGPALSGATADSAGMRAGGLDDLNMDLPDPDQAPDDIAAPEQEAQPAHP